MFSVIPVNSYRYSFNQDACGLVPQVLNNYRPVSNNTKLIVILLTHFQLHTESALLRLYTDMVTMVEGKTGYISSTIVIRGI